ncbi:Cytosine-specific methyltransferase [Quillaja saponaria]|uniref:Cytosine-specific methyltransferase n=1 Tax=Quillaja saponaria TaxID=32244 RepID=A0AAD7L9R8_QUISA|nr:Cytosine-specific methyltransferase [Quillaja saponaria]
MTPLKLPETVKIKPLRVSGTGLISSKNFSSKMRPPRKSHSFSKAKSNSLSLTLSKNVAEDQPVPLKIFHPPFSASICLRRSPRFTAALKLGATGSKFKMWEEKRLKRSMKLARLMHAQGLRRSPRLKSGLLENLGDNNADPGSGTFTNKSGTNKVKICLDQLNLRTSGGKSLRRSPRFSTAKLRAENGKTGSRIVKGKRCSPELLLNGDSEDKESVLNVKSQEEKCFRRSPQLTTSQSEAKQACLQAPLRNGDGEDNETVKCLEEKCFRRSPRLTSTQSEYKRVCLRASFGKMSRSPEKSSFGVELSETSNLSTDVKLYNHSLNKDVHKGMLFIDCHSEVTVEKHLRRSPRLITTSADGNKQIGRKFDVKVLNGMPTRRSPRLSSSTENKNGKVIYQKKENLKVVYQESESSKITQTSTELSNSSMEKHSKNTMSSSGKSTPGNLEEKCFVQSPEKTTSESGVEYCRVNSDYLSVLESDDKCFRQFPETITSQSGVEYHKANSDYTSFPNSEEQSPPKKFKSPAPSTNKNENKKCVSFFLGDPIPNDEARERWGWRYEMKNKLFKGQNFTVNDDEDEIILNVECHYAQAKIENWVLNLGDCAYIKGEGYKKHVGRVIELFRTTNGEDYFRVQWFYRVEDTVIKEAGDFHDKRRLFYSTIMNDNLLDCILAKVKVTQITPRVGLKLNSIPPSNFYYDMEYCVDYSTFRSLETDKSTKGCKLSSPSDIKNITLGDTASVQTTSSESYKAELALLDLYSGCGGMSTGLCLGARVSSVDIVTRWALDSNKSACESLKLNHPDTHVRNESAEDFLELLKEWEKLCKRYRVDDAEKKHQLRSNTSKGVRSSVNSYSDDEGSTGEYEVSRIIDICFGDPNENGKSGINFKVHWKGYSASEDTWEPIEGLSNCQESIQDFVRKGMKSKMLPTPGDVDVICGGPPCQGISGYNRYRNIESPLDDERNRQIIIFMDIVKFLMPKYVLMENVVDILRLDNASLGRYALSRLVHMHYQARLGTIAAGCYGLPQFRLRVFLWGAHPGEILPQFPLPTHDVVVRYWPPLQFERNTVAYDEDQPRELEKAIILQDAISDLPAVENDETREEMSYQKSPETEFQRYIRSTEDEMIGSTSKESKGKGPSLYDHQSYLLSEDDYLRVCQIPKKKGANFRDLPGVVVGADNVVRRDPRENQLLPSWKAIVMDKNVASFPTCQKVPDYAFTFEQGRSKRPFARLWWDETVPTVLTFPSCHNQAILHPEQDRILTVRECARLQGFPDYYRFCGTVKSRYCQIGNAVAVPVARALGYSLGLAYRKLSGNEPLMTLPPKFSLSNYLQLADTLS